MVVPGDFQRQLAAAARDMAGQRSTENTLEHAVDLAVEMIDSCDIAGISMIHPGGIDTPVATDEKLREADELQFTMNQGPCLDAMRKHETISSNDLTVDPRWPEFGPRIAADAGVRSCLCFRLFGAGDSLGALNLYSRRPNAFSSTDLDNGVALAAQIAVALAASQSETHLNSALVTRTVIGQAQGILMERFDLEADPAFRVLVRFSSQLNIKLRDAARQVVDTRQLPGQGDSRAERSTNGR